MRLLCVMVVLLAAAAGCGPQPNLEAEQAAIRAAEAEWVKAVAAKDAGRVVAFYAEDGMLLPPGAPPVRSREALRAAWSQEFGDPNYALTWQATKVEVARSGDLAYAFGSYAFTSSGPKGEPQTERGKYVVVWRKQADGAWKAVADIWNPDAPPPVSAP